MTDTERLEAVRAALFPKPEPINGEQRHVVSHDVLDNLEAVLIDLDRTGADTACIRSLRYIVGQIEVAARFAGRDNA